MNTRNAADASSATHNTVAFQKIFLRKSGYSWNCDHSLANINTLSRLICTGCNKKSVRMLSESMKYKLQ